MARQGWRDGLSDDDIDDCLADRRFKRFARQHESDPHNAHFDPLPATRREYEARLAEENAEPEVDCVGGGNALTWEEAEAYWGHIQLGEV